MDEIFIKVKDHWQSQCLDDAEETFFEGTYNRDGLLIAEKSRPGVDKEYSYDKLGRIVEVKTGGDVTERYSYTTKGRTVTFTDGKGSDYVYSFDEFGRLTQEKNRLIILPIKKSHGILNVKKFFTGILLILLYMYMLMVETIRKMLCA